MNNKYVKVENMMNEITDRNNKVNNMNNKDLIKIKNIIESKWSSLPFGNMGYALSCMECDLKEMKRWHTDLETPEMKLLKRRIKRLKAEIDQIESKEQHFYRTIQEMITPHIKPTIVKELTFQDHIELEKMMRLKDEEIN
jgi:hypothetical protein|tara:strand:+ start:22 stop:441 length:420 start_codon:yes stop_codon:yes gene_type:complete